MMAMMVATVICGKASDVCEWKTMAVLRIRSRERERCFSDEFVGPDSQQVILEILTLHCAAEGRSYASRAISNSQPMLRDTPRGETLLGVRLAGSYRLALG